MICRKPIQNNNKTTHTHENVLVSNSLLLHTSSQPTPPHHNKTKNNPPPPMNTSLHLKKEELLNVYDPTHTTQILVSLFKHLKRKYSQQQQQQTCYKDGRTRTCTRFSNSILINTLDIQASPTSYTLVFEEKKK